MKRCSRCRKESHYLLLCLALNKAGLKAREDYKTKKESIYSRKSKIVTLKLCSNCILECDLAKRGCGHCDMGCSFEKHYCPTYLERKEVKMVKKKKEVKVKKTPKEPELAQQLGKDSIGMQVGPVTEK